MPRSSVRIYQSTVGLCPRTQRTSQEIPGEPQVSQGNLHSQSLVQNTKFTVITQKH